MMGHTAVSDEKEIANQILHHRAVLYQIDRQRAQLQAELDALELEQQVLARHAQQAGEGDASPGDTEQDQA